jgi:hypothetical protein
MGAEIQMTMGNEKNNDESRTPLNLKDELLHNCPGLQPWANGRD